ncbi:MAG: Tetratricopeptide repeat-containing protein [Gemmatimonadetes bacterium]|nr:Tetratricopeptide repeat-containing protein [Gemmatimonadota bacterium]
MAIEGPLRELALSDVFQLLDLSRKTGVLTISNEARAKPAVVRFDRGAVVSAELPGSTERLGHLLLRAGKVTEAEVEGASRVQQGRPGVPLGVILVEQGVVSTADVQRQLRFQIQETVYDLIQWKDGYFRFEEAAAPTPSPVAVRVSTESLLMEAARRIDEWSTLEKKIPHMGVIPALVGDTDGATIDLHPSEWEVLAEIDGMRTLKEISGSVGRGEFEVAKIVYGLVSTGVVEILEERAPEPPAPAWERPLRDALGEAKLALSDGAVERARRALDELARSHPDRAEVFLLLSESQRRLGRWSEALHSLGRAAALDPLSPHVHYHLGFASAHTGDLARSLEAWENYLRLGDADARRQDVAARALSAAQELRMVLEEAGE